jgi:hypothetical protein
VGILSRVDVWLSVCLGSRLGAILWLLSWTFDFNFCPFPFWDWRWHLLPVTFAMIWKVCALNKEHYACSLSEHRGFVWVSRRSCLSFGGDFGRVCGLMGSAACRGSFARRRCGMVDGQTFCMRFLNYIFWKDNCGT